MDLENPKGGQGSFSLLRQHLEAPGGRGMPLPHTQPGPYELVRRLH